MGLDKDRKQLHKHTGSCTYEDNCVVGRVYFGGRCKTLDPPMCLCGPKVAGHSGQVRAGERPGWRAGASHTKSIDESNPQGSRKWGIPLKVLALPWVYLGRYVALPSLRKSLLVQLRNLLSH